MMEVLKTGLEGVLLIKPHIFEDHRGDYVETYNEKEYMDNGIAIKFIQDDISTSKKNVLRGIHGDDETWKLASCIFGKIYHVVVNCDKESEFFGKWQSFILSERNRHQVLVPPKHGQGFLALSDEITFHYKQSTYYDRAKQFTYRWDDTNLKIWWPCKNPILSQRDE